MALLIVLLLAIFLSWGHNWMFLTNLFADFFLDILSLDLLL